MEYPLAVFTPQVGTVSETFIRRHVNDLLPNGTVTIACQIGDPRFCSWCVDGPVLVLDHVQRIRFTQENGWEFTSRHLASVRRFLREHHVQVVLGEYLDVCLPLLEIAVELDIPFWGHAHGYDISMRLRDANIRNAYRRYRRAAGIIIGCKWARERLTTIGLSRDKLHIVPCGVDLPKRHVDRHKNGIINCLAVGRFVPKKAPLVTLDAFRQALLVCPNLRLDYIGSGELASAAREYIHRFGLAKKVGLCGSLCHKYVKQYMRSAEIFLQHSLTDPITGDQEMMPVGILEAMAFNLPVVSTKHAGIPEAVDEGVTGYLVDEGDSTGMAEHIVELALDRELRKRMGCEARERVNTRFSWSLERIALLNLLSLRRKKAQTAGV